MRKTCPRSIRCEEAWYALAAVDLSYCESSPLHFMIPIITIIGTLTAA